MENLPKLEKRSKNESLNSKLGNLAYKVKKALIILSASAGTFFSACNQESRNSDQNSVPEDTKQTVLIYHKDYGSSVVQPSEEMISSQEKENRWILNYIESPKYKERLGKEYLRWKMAGSPETPKDYAKTQKNLIGYIRNEKGERVAHINLISKEIVFKLAEGDSAHQVTYRLGKDKTIVEKEGKEVKVVPTSELISKGFLNNFNISPESFSIDHAFKEVDLSLLNNEDKKIIEKVISQRKQSVLLSKNFTFVKKGTLKKNVLGESVLSSNGQDERSWIDQDPRVSRNTVIADLYSMKGTIVHENTHASTLSGIGVPASTKYILQSRANANFDKSRSSWETKYAINPSEIIPRFTEFRYMLKESGIYDANTEDFKIEILDKYRKYSEKNKDSRFLRILEDLRTTFDDEEIVWIMNNIAQNSSKEKTEEMV